MRWIFLLGVGMLVLTFCVFIYVLVARYFTNDVNPGWASIMLSMWFIGSLILIAIGIAGEYIGKIFVEVKGRPRYAVADTVWD